jgi:toxin ParE1/3/4
MTEVVFRPAAEDDLRRPYRYIARRAGPDVAIGYIRRIRAQCEILSTFPQSGRARDDLRPGARLIGFERRIAIIYAIAPSGDVEIGRVFYGGRNYERLMNRRGSSRPD